MKTGESGQSGFKSRLSALRHDLRTPVGHIMGYAELIEEELDEGSLAAWLHDLRAIQTAGQKILALIDNFFGDSKTSAEEIAFYDAQFQLRLLLNHIAGYAEILRENALEEGHSELLGDLDHIVEAQRRVILIIEMIGEDLLSEGAAPSSPSAFADTSGSDAAEPIVTIAGIGGDILVVDDDPGNRELLTRRLARGGYTALAVASGEQALEVLDKRRFDLVLLDQMMPGKSGLEILQILKADTRLRPMPVLMLSASDNSDLMVRCILDGAEDYVAKPFNPVLLIARINACLEKVRLRKSAARQIKVFISSPGDVIAERQVVKAVLSRLNDEFSGRAILIPILWEEEPLLASDTFQAQIHPPRQTEIYVGILWSRIGSPLPASITRADGSQYESGTAFEFEDALSGHAENGFPEMLLYRKSGAPVISLQDRQVVLDRVDQIERLKSYIDRRLMAVDGSYVSAFHVFETVNQLETMVETHVRKLVERLLARE
jgi:CheY-like chemotaxis protein